MLRCRSVYLRILDRIMTQEYAALRALGYSAREASLLVDDIRNDFWRIVECRR